MKPSLKDRWSRLPTRDRRAYLVISIALAALLVAYGVMPALDSWGATRDNIAQEHEQLDHVAEKLADWEAMRDRLRPIYGSAIDAPLPALAEARIHLVKTVQDTLQAGGLGVESIRPQGVRPIKEVPGVSMAMYQVSGKLQGGQLPQFLAAINKAPQVLVVEHLSMTSEASNPSALSVSLTLAAYIRDRDGGGK